MPGMKMPSSIKSAHKKVGKYLIWFLANGVPCEVRASFKCL
jgi:hypothetical protein